MWCRYWGQITILGMLNMCILTKLWSWVLASTKDRNWRRGCPRRTNALHAFQWPELERSGRLSDGSSDRHSWIPPAMVPNRIQLLHYNPNQFHPQVKRTHHLNAPKKITQLTNLTIFTCSCLPFFTLIDIWFDFTNKCNQRHLKEGVTWVLKSCFSVTC